MTGCAYVLDSGLDLPLLLDRYLTYRRSDEYIYNAYMIPRFFIDCDFQSNINEFHGQASPNTYSLNISKPTTLDNYSPKNKKLLTYPYCYLLLSNNAGNSNILHYEKFNTQYNCEFYVTGIPIVGGSIKCTPVDYGTANSNVEEESIIANKFPILNWNKDNYADWLLVNSTSLNNQKLMGNAQYVGGATIAIAGVGMAIGGISTMFAGNQQIYQAISTDIDHSKTPDSASGLGNGADVNTALGKNGFYLYRYSIKREFAEMIDHYFDMYGYKVNSLEVPNLSTRVNWNYLKVLDPNIEGNNIPEKDINKYKEMLQNGITFWHNINTFRDYSQNNGNS